LQSIAGSVAAIVDRGSFFNQAATAIVDRGYIYFLSRLFLFSITATFIIHRGYFFNHGHPNQTDD
jgi:hypothetical protein